jgi:hypothetical protein
MYNSIFDWTLPVTRNDFLVSSEPHSMNPYLKAVDYVIHGNYVIHVKLRDSRKTT